MITVPSFRANYLEFNDQSRFPNSMVQYYLTLSTKLINNPARWAEIEDDGRMLFIAHHVVLERKALDEANQGNVPGTASGPVNSRSVDKVSVGYDTAAGTIPGAGHWNLTQYGIRLKQLFDMIGAGPVQVGAESCGPGLSGAAWQGPPVYNFPNPSG